MTPEEWDELMKEDLLLFERSSRVLSEVLIIWRTLYLKNSDRKELQDGLMKLIQAAEELKQSFDKEIEQEKKKEIENLPTTMDAKLKLN